MVTGGWDGTLRLWEEEGRCIETYTEHMETIYALERDTREGDKLGCFTCSEVCTTCAEPACLAC